MTQALARKETLAVQTARECGVSDARLQLIKDTFAKGATDDELSLFMLTAHRTGLDPMARQLFVVKRYDSVLQKQTMSIQISIDGFRLIADRTEKYVPGREATYTYDPNGNLESATAYVKKLVGGTWHEISATAFHSEYVQTTKEKKPNSMWSKMPRLMLAKCAESLALRKAFPAELSGLYTADEMGTVEENNSAKPHLAEVVQIKEQSNATKTLDAELTDLCKNLNDAKDSIKWTGAQLTAYARSYFENDSLKSYQSLSDEDKNILVGDLTQRLAEQEAIKEEHSEVIDGEIVESETPEMTAKEFEDEVF
jgi:phage recombination protein Bet